MSEKLVYERFIELRNVQQGISVAAQILNELLLDNDTEKAIDFNTPYIRGGLAAAIEAMTYPLARNIDRLESLIQETVLDQDNSG